MVNKTSLLRGALLVALLCAACLAPRVALADDFLNGTLSERDACIDVGMYSLWRSTTGRELNGYDYSQSMYSDTNLSMIHQWNQDFRQFNIDNGNAINTVWPVSEVHDIIYLPASVTGSYQYDDLRTSLGETYDDFRYRYPNASANGYQINYGEVSNPLKSLMSGFALSNSSKEYGTFEPSDSDWYSHIAFGVNPAFRFTYNGVSYQIGYNETNFNLLNNYLSDSPSGLYLGKHSGLMFYAAFPSDSYRTQLPMVLGWTLSDNDGPVVPIPYSVSSSGSISSSVNAYSFTGFVLSSSNSSSFLYRANTTNVYFSTIQKLIQRYGNDLLLLPVSGGGGFAAGGGENNPTTEVYNPGTYINVPGPNSTVNIYQVTNEPASNGSVTDTESGLGWLGDLLNLLINAVRDLLSFLGGLFDSLLNFITDFVIGDLDSIDFDDLKMPDISGVFPFCIPHDVVNILQMFNSEPVAPSFDFPVTNVDGSVENISVDLNVFSPAAAVLRTGEVVVFVVGLALGTRKILGG